MHIDTGTQLPRSSVLHLDGAALTADQDSAIFGTADRWTRPNDFPAWIVGQKVTVAIALGPSDIATLDGLALADRNGDPVALEPGFDPETADYDVRVASGVNRLTVTAAVTDSIATWELVDEAGRAYPDADNGAPGHQVDLLAGLNVVGVRVTAENGDTRTYRLDVLRQATGGSVPARPTGSTAALVANTGQTEADGNYGQVVAQGFTTGTNAAGYALDSIGIHLGSGTGTTGVRVRLFAAHANGTVPGGSGLFTFANPATVTAGALNTFTAPARTTLAADTTYFVIVTPADGSFAAPGTGTSLTASDNEDAGAAAGWSIANALRFRSGTAWTAHANGRSLRMSANGRALANNAAATGKPAIAGAARAGTTLTANLGTVADDNGISARFPEDFTFRWWRGDAQTDGTAIAGATGRTYRLTGDDVGHKVQVQVTFTDDGGAREHAYSDLFPSGASASIEADPARFTAKLTVGELYRGTDLDHLDIRGYSEIENPDVGFLDKTTFTHDGETRTVRAVLASPWQGKDGGVYLQFDGGRSAMDAMVADGMVLEWLGVEFPLAEAEIVRDTYFQWDDGWMQANAPHMLRKGHFAEALIIGGRLDVCLRTGGEVCIGTSPDIEPNRPATGRPAIAGAPLVGQTLTAQQGDLRDSNGLPEGAFPGPYRFQWHRLDDRGRNPEAIDGADRRRYRLTAADVGKRLRVTVSFRDRTGRDESRASEPAPVTVARGSDGCLVGADWCATLTAGTHPNAVAGQSQHGHDAGTGTGSLDDASVAGAFTVQRILYRGSADDTGGQHVSVLMDPAVPNAPVPYGTVFLIGGTPLVVDRASRLFEPSDNVWDVPAGTLNWPDGHQVTVSLKFPPPVNAAQGVPLVANTGQRQHYRASPRASQSKRFAQKFTTGSATGGYGLDGIGLMSIENKPNQIMGGLQVRIHAAGADGRPGARLFDLENPFEMGGGRTVCQSLRPPLLCRPQHPPVSLFRAPAGARLEPNTEYFVVVGARLFVYPNEQGVTNFTVTYPFSVTGSAAEDGAAPGWRIADEMLFSRNGGWAVRTDAVHLAVYGANSDDAAPPALAVADASAEETHEALAFEVTLDRAADADVTVRYRTRDGTATAGRDYEQTEGILTIPAGETAGTILVPILDDAEEDGGETLTLTLHDPDGAALADASATGTIGNSEALWTARLAVAERDGWRGYSKIANPDLGALSGDRFDYGAGAPFQVLNLVAHPDKGLVFDVRNRAAELAGLVLEWAGETLPLDQAALSRNRYTWSPAWLAEHAPALAPARLAATLPHGGAGVACLRTAAKGCPDTAVADPSKSPGPPMLAVADAETREARGATLDFTVTLSRAAGGAVTVRYATADGSATAGADYEARSGTLTFAPGETEKTVAVPVLDDSVDEGRETMTFTLANPVGAFIADATATGTIRNTDRMPTAWLARFGRTVAEQIVAAVQGRIRAAPAPGVSLTLAGEKIGGSPEPEGEAAEKARKEAQAQAEMKRISDWLLGKENPDERRGWRPVTTREILLGSSFQIAADADGIGGGVAAIWGQASAAGFSGRDDEVSVSGTVTTTMIGADWTKDGPNGGARDGWTVGLLAGRAHGAGDYTGADDGGTVSSTVTGLFPYGRYALTDRVTVWGVAGYGAGTLEMDRDYREDGHVLHGECTPNARLLEEQIDHGPSTSVNETCTVERTETWRTGMDLMMAAAGLRGTVLQAPAEGGPELAVTADAMAVRTTSDAARAQENGSRLAAATGDATRLRLGLDASWRGLSLGAGTLTPSLALAVRHDGGDAETGFGLDLGGGLAWSDPESGFRAELRGRGLLTHESAGFRNRGIAGSLSWQPRAGTGRGPRLTLSQTLGGAASGGAAALLNRTTLEGLTPTGDGGELSRGRLEIGAGYGFAVLGGNYLWTPEFGFAMAADARDYSLGWTLARRMPGDIGALELALEGQRRESGAGIPAEHSLGLRLTARW